MKYPGGKGGAGVFHKIIGMMPPHDVYIEAFVGGGAVFENKRPAASSIVIDADGEVCRHWSTIAESGDSAGESFTVIHGDAVRFLNSYKFTGDELVYLDPPYLMSTRRGGEIYRHELSDDQHRGILSLLSTMPARWMLSGYRSAMYDDAADRHGWRRYDFMAMTHRGPATESVWTNFDPPAVLHDARFLGENFRERERLKRKAARWRSRFASMQPGERQMMLRVLRDLESPDLTMRTASPELERAADVASLDESGDNRSLLSVIPRTEL